jgi:hypothetical protein
MELQEISARWPITYYKWITIELHETSRNMDLQEI